MTLIQELYTIRSRAEWNANDITMWIVKVFGEFYGISLSSVRTEVIIKGESKGRADVVIQDSVGIETKRFLSEEIADAKVQVKRILRKLETEGDRAPVAIATDGEKWKFFVLAGGELFEVHSFEIGPTLSDTELKNRLWTALTTFRHEKDRPQPTAEAIAEVFRPLGPSFNEARSQLIAEASFILDKNQTAFGSKFEPWFEVFSYVYNNFEARCASWESSAKDLHAIAKQLQKAGRFTSVKETVVVGALELFIRHTYLALLAKMLATIATLGEEGVTKGTLKNPRELLSGEAVRSCGVWITEPNDFFVWPAAGGSPGKLVGTLLRPLQRFSAEYNDDVFRHLYESVVDSDTRHELGEFFTPKWIAQLMVRDTIDDAHMRVLDPACGSGTFLVMALRKKAELGTIGSKKLHAQQITKFLDEVWGLDVNPLSVVLARTNLYLTISSLLSRREQPSEIHPRIYVSDTLILPRFEDAEQTRLSTENKQGDLVSTPITPNINVPTLPRLSPEEALRCVDVASEAYDSGHTKIIGKTGCPPDIVEYENALLMTMKDLKKKYGNSLWKFVLRNYGIPPLIRRSFDVVLGNPPWLSFREARKRIQDTIDELADSYGVTPGGESKTSFNLGVAFFLACTHFAKPNGLIGFVLPLSVLDSPAHTRFIELLLQEKTMKAEKIYDLGGIQPSPFPHNLQTAIVIARVNS